VNLQELLARGYLPPELPPPFTSEPFADYVCSSNVSLPNPTQRSAKLVVHDLGRYGRLRRKLGIPNPVPHLTLCKEIAAQWTNIEAHTAKSRFSVSIPTYPSTTLRSVSPYTPIAERALKRAVIRAAGRYSVQTDVSLFYPSIYTHSIPWAFHSKSVAKKDRTDRLYGNILDGYVRNCQDKQTIGIPIGPDTSYIIAESIFTSVDLALDKSLISSLIHGKGMRYSDEYEFVVRNIGHAEIVYSFIQYHLSQLGLSINTTKSRILELPSIIDNTWVKSLHDFHPSSSKGRQGISLVRYFDLAFQLAHDNPEGNVVKYAVALSASIDVHPSNWPLFEALLLQSTTVEPTSLVHALGIIQRARSAGWKIDRDAMSEVLDGLILRHAPTSHGSEVAWAIWGAIVFGIDIEQEAATEISKMEDSIVALLALDAFDRGIISNLSAKIWSQYLSESELYGDHWLLAYEAGYQDFKLFAGQSDYVAKDKYFADLRSNGVSFYRRLVRPSIAPRAILFPISASGSGGGSSSSI
jgi:hypothetical protein